MHDKNFNFQDSNARLIFDRHLTMAIKPRLLKTFETKLFDEPISYQDVVVEYDNPFLALLGKLANKETMSEEMRIYYQSVTLEANRPMDQLDLETLRELPLKDKFFRQ